MRVSTQQIYQRGINSILEHQRGLSQQQIHIASGKRINTPADDPIGASQAIFLRQQIHMSERLQNNAESATSRLQLEDDILGNITNVVQQIRESIIEAGSAALGPEGRRAIRQNLAEKMTELAGLANTRDANGGYLFAGYQTNTQPFTENALGQYVYQGDDGQRYLEVSEGLVLAVSDSGLALFNSARTGNGTFAVIEGTTNLGTAIVGATSVVDATNYQADDYTLSFVTNAAGELAYQVVGSNTGQVIPPLPATIPDDAPSYTEGQAITFQGLQIPLEGLPQAGDSFAITPSRHQDIFAIVQDTIAALDSPVDEPNQKASQQNRLNTALSELDQAMNAIIGVRTSVGARLSAIDSAKEANADFILHSQTALSKVEDLDFAQAIADFNARQAALEAAQASYIRTQGLSLFKFI